MIYKAFAFYRNNGKRRTRSASDAPNSSHSRFLMSWEVFWNHLGRFLRGQDACKTASRLLKMAPRRLKMAPRRPKMVLRRPKMSKSRLWGWQEGRAITIVVFDLFYKVIRSPGSSKLCFRCWAGAASERSERSDVDELDQTTFQLSVAVRTLIHPRALTRSKR